MQSCNTFAYVCYRCPTYRCIEYATSIDKTPSGVSKQEVCIGVFFCWKNDLIQKVTGSVSRESQRWQVVCRGLRLCKTSSVLFGVCASCATRSTARTNICGSRRVLSVPTCRGRAMSPIGHPTAPLAALLSAGPNRSRTDPIYFSAETKSNEILGKAAFWLSHLGEIIGAVEPKQWKRVSLRLLLFLCTASLFCSAVHSGVLVRSSEAGQTERTETSGAAAAAAAAAARQQGRSVESCSRWRNMGTERESDEIVRVASDVSCLFVSLASHRFASGTAEQVDDG